jgi:xanthine dehydrogenase YagS FAD-binding subunit
VNGPSFQYGRAENAHDALIQASKPGAAYIAGGTDLLQLWKSGAMAPVAVIDISRLPLRGVEFIDGQLSLGALARLRCGDLRCGEISSVDRRRDPGQRQRQMQYGDGRWQSIAANPLPYFRNDSWSATSESPAADVVRFWRNRHAALFGTSPLCASRRTPGLTAALAALGRGRGVRVGGERRFSLRGGLYRPQ